MGGAQIFTKETKMRKHFLAGATLVLVALLSGCAAPATTPTISPVPTDMPTTTPPTSTPTPAPPTGTENKQIGLRIDPAEATSETGLGLTFIAQPTVNLQELPADCLWEWDFGDSTDIVNLTGNLNNTVWHAYLLNGQYTVKLSLHDAKQNLLATATSKVAIDDLAVLKSTRSLVADFYVYATYIETDENALVATNTSGDYSNWCETTFSDLTWTGNDFYARVQKTMSDGGIRVFQARGTVSSGPTLVLTSLTIETDYIAPNYQGHRSFQLMDIPLRKNRSTINLMGTFSALITGSEVQTHMADTGYAMTVGRGGSPPVQGEIYFTGFDWNYRPELPKINIQFWK
jgi:hypothetical protein